MVYASLYQGLRVEGPLMSEIALNHPENLADLTDVIEKYVNQEEILTALRESQKKTPRRKKKPGRKKNGPTPKKSLRSITNFPISEVLMEIKRDPQYEKPYPLHNKHVKEENRNKLCTFHNA
jgi:hypothetical protein